MQFKAPFYNKAQIERAIDVELKLGGEEVCNLLFQYRRVFRALPDLYEQVFLGCIYFF